MRLAKCACCIQSDTPDSCETFTAAKTFAELSAKMSSVSLMKKVLPLAAVQWPLQTQVRTMRAVNTRMKKPMHIMRAKLMKLTEYKKPKENRRMAEMCSVHLKSVTALPENPTQTFYAKHCFNTLKNCKLVAVFHNEGLDIEDMTRFSRRLYKHNMLVKYWGPAVLKEALANTRLQHLEGIVHRSNLYVVCEEATVKELLKATKRAGRVHLLGGLVEDRFMSPKQMEEYSLLPSLQLARGQLSGLLRSSISKTYSLLQSNQQMLSSNLDQLSKGNVNKDVPQERTET